jgi:hypothetical protein
MITIDNTGYCPSNHEQTMLKQYPRIRPDEHRAIGDIVILAHPQDTDDCSHK